MRNLKQTIVIHCLTVAVALFYSVATMAAESPVKVNALNFARAETAAQFDRALDLSGGINILNHFREPTPLDKQSVIRMNRDTLYSFAIVNIRKGATLTLPDSGERYISVMIINEDHYINRIYHDVGKHKLTMKEFKTPFVMVAVRTLMNASDAEDIEKANVLQDAMMIEAASNEPYTHSEYDQESYEATYKPLLELSRGIPDATRTFGKKEEVNKVKHLFGTAFGWGGLPETEAFYINVEPRLPVSSYELTVKDVPVDAFWSISVYNKDGYFEPNEHDAYSVNNLTATPNQDGSYTIHFGGDPKAVNFLSITEGWNYTVRLYQPRKEILDGTWTFPGIKKSQ